MDRLPPRARIVAVLAGLAIAGACANPASPLASQGGGDGGAAGSAAATAGTGGTSSSSAGHAGSGGFSFDAAPDAIADVVQPPDAPPPDAVPDVYVDPDGPPELRFLHGLADAPTVRACLVPWKDGAASATPITVPSGDVAYGGVILVTPPAGAGALRTIVLSGDLAKVGGASCQDVLASPPTGVQITALDVLPAGTLDQPRSLLMVATGCAGGVAVADALTVCGTAGVPPKVDAGADAGTLPDLSTAGLVVVEVSRVAPPADQIGVQVMHASATLGALDVRLLPEGGQTPVKLAGALGLGAIAPHPPLLLNVEVAFGAVPIQAVVGVSDGAGDVVLAGVGPALLASGLTTTDLAPGKGFVLVILGPHPSPSDAGTGGNPVRVAWMKQPLIAN